jgi:environmental stress-induced protein Ves
MSWQLVKLAEVAATPWRNGGGVTRELAAWPAGADWDWRLSVAEVDQSGPFSLFEGVDRWFAVLSGAGVELDIGGQKHRVTAGGVPVFFDGGAATDCRLIAGRTQDFNLMSRRSRTRSGMARIAGRLEQRLEASASAPRTVAVYAAGAGATLELDGETSAVPEASLAWRRFDSPAHLTITAHEALFMEIGT